MPAKKAAAKKKAPASKKKLAKKASRGPLRASKAKAQARSQGVHSQNREVSQAHERQEGPDQAGRSQGSTQTIREEDDRYRTEEAGPRPAGARSRGVETRSARPSPRNGVVAAAASSAARSRASRPISRSAVRIT